MSKKSKRNKNTNIITWKIEYSCNTESSNIINEYIKAYNPILRYTYNRLLKNKDLTTAELTALQKLANKSNLLGSHLLNSIIYDAKALIADSDKPIIFGGKKNFIARCQHKITKEEFNKNKLMPLYSVGEARQTANRLFRILDKDTIIFQPNRNTKITLNIINLGKNRTKEIAHLIRLQNNKQIPITYKLSDKFIYLSFDYNKYKQSIYKVKENRVIAVDLNPNYLGYSVVDWLGENNYNIITSGSYSIKPLNDYSNSLSVSSNSKEATYVNNKRNHEVIHIAKELFNLCKYYKCEVFAIEDLNITTNNIDKGRKLNGLINNQWNRNLFINHIGKLVKSSSTLFVPVQCQYSSYVGNLVYRQENLPDECLASIEIGRRGYEFTNQYIKCRQSHKKNVIFPFIETVNNQLSISLEEIGVDVPLLDNWKNICSVIKKSKVKYRFSREIAIKKHINHLFSKNYKNRYINLHIFI